MRRVCELEDAVQNTELLHASAEPVDDCMRNLELAENLLLLAHVPDVIDALLVLVRRVHALELVEDRVDVIDEVVLGDLSDQSEPESGDREVVLRHVEFLELLENPARPFVELVTRPVLALHALRAQEVLELLFEGGAAAGKFIAIRFGACGVVHSWPPLFLWCKTLRSTMQ